jgi:hypothetical protein
MAEPREVETLSVLFEMPRRLILTVAIVVGIWITFATYERAYLMVSAVEPPKEPASRSPHSTAPSLLGPEAEKVWEEREKKTPVVIVSGNAWVAFFANVQRIFAEGVPEPGWRDHLVGYDERDIARYGKTRIKYLYFAMDDPPFPSIAGELSVNRSFALRLDRQEVPPLKVFVSPPYNPGLGGSTPFSYSYYPRKYAYPYGAIGLYLIGIGFLAYFVLPWPRRAPNLVSLGRFRIIATDVVSIGILFGLFFALPFLITGRSIGVVTEFWFLTAFCWVIASLGAVCIFWAARYAALHVIVLPDRLRFVSLRGAQEFRLADLEYVQPSSFRPSKWLVVASIARVFLGRDLSLTAGQAGRALILATSRGGGLYFKTRDGRTAYLWYTDQSGSVAMQNLDRLAHALEAARVPVKDELRNLRGIFPPQR